MCKILLSLRVVTSMALGVSTPNPRATPPYLGRFADLSAKLQKIIEF